MVATLTERTTAAAPPRFRLERAARRTVLLVHIVAAGAWIGIDVVLGVLVFTARLTTSPSTESLCYRVLELFAVGPLLTAGLLTLASGVVLGLGTKYGLVRYWWVAVKLVLNVVLVTAVLFALRPAVHDAAAYGEALAAGGDPPFSSVSQLVMPPLVSGTALLVASVLSVFKPWGRVRQSVPS